MKSKPIFAYTYSGGWGYIDDLFIFSTRVFDSGILMYKDKYGLSRFKLSRDTINKIRKIIEDNYDSIKNIEPIIDNGSCDGNENEFIFLDKKIVDSNISDYLDSEKTILKVFRLITDTLKEDGFDLRLDGFSKL